MTVLTPKLLTTLQGYSKEKFLSDALAGVIVGIVAIPLAIAFGIASGVSPASGLFTAVIAGFLVSALGGSRVQIGGPTGAFIVVVYGIVQKYGTDGLIVATLLAGLILIIMGLAKFGTIIKFVPHSVVIGFTSGIAVVILSSQIKDFFGLPVGEVPVEFLDKWAQLFENIAVMNPWAVLLAVSTVVLIFGWPLVSRRIPGSVIALIATSAAAAYFQLPVETIGSRFGELPHNLPMPHLPTVNWAIAKQLFQPAFTIAVLGAIESLLSAVVADGMIGGKHRSNMELIGQGAANIGSALFGGMPATGAIARTVTNIKNGGRTPVAGIVHSLTILTIILFLGAWIRFVPLACLAGILVVVAYHMSEWRAFRELLSGSREGIAVVLVTFFVTVLVDLTAAIQLGVVLSAFIFLKKMADATEIKIIAHEIEADESDADSPPATYRVPKDVEVFEIDGPLFFGVASQLDDVDRAINQKPRVRILHLVSVPVIDTTGLHAFDNFCRKCQRGHIAVFMTGLDNQPLPSAVKARLTEWVGKENIFPTVESALQRAEMVIQEKKAGSPPGY